MTFVYHNKESVKKDFDAVKFMRETRDKITLEVKGMTFEELKKYFKRFPRSRFLKNDLV